MTLIAQRSRRAFLQDLAAVHLAEAGSVYERCVRLRSGIVSDWCMLELLEDRLEANIDGLVATCPASLELCAAQLCTASAGHVYAAGRVLTRVLGLEATVAAASQVDLAVAEHRASLSSALARELQSSDTSLVEATLQLATPHLAEVLAGAAGRRRLPVGAALQRAARSSSEGTDTFLWALGRLRDPTAAMLFFRAMQGQDLAQRARAACAAARLGQPQVSSFLSRAVAAGEGWAALGLSLCGDRMAGRSLLALLERHGPTRDTLWALALHGSSAAIEPLLACAAVDGVRPIAQESLELVLGPAQLQGDVGSLEALTQRYRGLAIKPSAGLRLRHGAPYSPSVALAALRPAGVISQPLRALAGDDVVARTGVDCGFDPELDIADQCLCLAQGQRVIEALGSERDGSRAPILGQWMLGGRRQ